MELIWIAKPKYYTSPADIAPASVCVDDGFQRAGSCYRSGHPQCQLYGQEAGGPLQGPLQGQERWGTQRNFFFPSKISRALNERVWSQDYFERSDQFLSVSSCQIWNVLPVFLCGSGQVLWLTSSFWTWGHSRRRLTLKQSMWPRGCRTTVSRISTSVLNDDAHHLSRAWSQTFLSIKRKWKWTYILSAVGNLPQ